jgi:hypothetical protein
MPLESPPRVQVSQRPGDQSDVKTDIEQLKGFAVATTQYLSTLYTKLRGPVLARDAVLTLAPLNQTVSASPTQAEVQAISSKVDEILAALQTAINTGQ